VHPDNSAEKPCVQSLFVSMPRRRKIWLKPDPATKPEPKTDRVFNRLLAEGPTENSRLQFGWGISHI
jgi:hypothetical protein